MHPPQWQGHNMTIAAPNLSFTVVAWESPCPCLPQRVPVHTTGDLEDKPAWPSFKPTAMTEHTVWRLGDCSVQCTTIGTWALLLGAWGWAYSPCHCYHNWYLTKHVTCRPADYIAVAWPLQPLLAPACAAQEPEGHLCHCYCHCLHQTSWPGA